MEMAPRKRGIFCKPAVTGRWRRKTRHAAYFGYNQRGFIVTYRPSVSTLTPLTPRYDAFLFAPVCNEASGMSLSVVSALVRANVDPWEEATRLATMPKAIAERALVATLDLIPGRNWKPAEAKTIAARLVRLLPQPGEDRLTEVSPGGANQISYWWLWLGFAIAISVLAPRHPAATTDAGIATSQSSATPATKTPGENAGSPGVSDRLP
jgi:hypothetical protein